MIHIIESNCILSRN